MRLRTLAFISSICLLISCSKDDTVTTGFIRGKIDGVAFECTTNLSANKPEQSATGVDDPALRIQGDWAGNTIKLFIIYEPSSISSRQYPFTATDYRSGTISMGGNSFYAGPAGAFLGPALLGSGSITITSISKKSVNGTFQFTTKPDSTGSIKTITDGEFSLSRN